MYEGLVEVPQDAVEGIVKCRLSVSAAQGLAVAVREVEIPLRTAPDLAQGQEAGDAPIGSLHSKRHIVNARRIEDVEGMLLSADAAVTETPLPSSERGAAARVAELHRQRGSATERAGAEICEEGGSRRTAPCQRNR